MGSGRESQAETAYGVDFLTPSILLSISVPGGEGTDSRAVVALAGWQATFAEYNGAWPVGRIMHLWGARFTCRGDTQLLEQAYSHHLPNEAVVELEIARTIDQDDGVLEAVRNAVIPAWLRDALSAGGPPDFDALNLSRPLVVPMQAASGNYEIEVVPFDAFPSTRRRTRDMRHARRFATVVRWRSGIIYHWDKPEGVWPMNDLEHPSSHFALPGRSGAQLTDLATRHIPPGERLSSWVDRVARVEVRGMRTLLREIGEWENACYEAAQSRGRLGDSLPTFSSEFRIMARYLNNARWSQRFYEHRPKKDPIFSQTAARAAMEGAGGEMLRLVELAEERLRWGHGLLTELDERVASAASVRSAEEATRLNRIVSTLGTIFLAPSLIAAVYGADLAPLENGIRGSVLELLAAMLAGGLLTASALRLTGGRAQGAVTLASLVLGSALVVIVLALHWGLSAVLWSGPVVLLLSVIVAARVFSPRSKGSGVTLDESTT